MVYKQLQPLEEWICDVCGDIISNAHDSWLEWQQDVVIKKDTDFRLVHPTCKKSSKDPNFILRDLYISRVTGKDGLSKLINILETGSIENIKDFTEIIRRLHLPYYESARQYLEIARNNGEYLSSDLTEQDCRDIISKYLKVQ